MPAKRKMLLNSTELLELHKDQEKLKQKVAELSKQISDLEPKFTAAVARCARMEASLKAMKGVWGLTEERSKLKKNLSEAAKEKKQLDIELCGVQAIHKMEHMHQLIVGEVIKAQDLAGDEVGLKQVRANICRFQGYASLVAGTLRNVVTHLTKVPKDKQKQRMLRKVMQMEVTGAMIEAIQDSDGMHMIKQAFVPTDACSELEKNLYFNSQGRAYLVESAVAKSHICSIYGEENVSILAHDAQNDTRQLDGRLRGANKASADSVYVIAGETTTNKIGLNSKSMQLTSQKDHNSIRLKLEAHDTGFGKDKLFPHIGILLPGGSIASLLWTHKEKAPAFVSASGHFKICRSVAPSASGEEVKAKLEDMLLDLTNSGWKQVTFGIETIRAMGGVASEKSLIAGSRLTGSDLGVKLETVVRNALQDKSDDNTIQDAPITDNKAGQSRGAHSTEFDFLWNNLRVENKTTMVRHTERDGPYVCVKNLKPHLSDIILFSVLAPGHAQGGSNKAILYTYELCIPTLHGHADFPDFRAVFGCTTMGVRGQDVGIQMKLCFPKGSTDQEVVTLLEKNHVIQQEMETDAE